MDLHKTLLSQIIFIAKMYWFSITLYQSFAVPPNTFHKIQQYSIWTTDHTCMPVLFKTLFNMVNIQWFQVYIKKELHTVTINQSQVCLTSFHYIFSINNFIKIFSGVAEKKFADWQTQAYNYEFILCTSRQEWPIMQPLWMCVNTEISITED